MSKIENLQNEIDNLKETINDIINLIEKMQKEIKLNNCHLNDLSDDFDEKYWETFDDSNYKDPIKY